MLIVIASTLVLLFFQVVAYISTGYLKLASVIFHSNSIYDLVG